MTTAPQCTSIGSVNYDNKKICRHHNPVVFMNVQMPSVSDSKLGHVRTVAANTITPDMRHFP